MPVPGRGEQPYAWMKSWDVTETQPAYTWLRANPHRFSLSRIGLTFADGKSLDFAKVAENAPDAGSVVRRPDQPFHL